MPDNNIYDFDKIKKEKELQEQRSATAEPSEEIKKIIAIYESFSESQQIIFSLYVILQCSTETIAEMVDCDDAYAKHQLQMALTALMDTNFTRWEDALVWQTVTSDDFKEFYPLHGKQYEQQMAEQEFTEQDLINNVITIQKKRKKKRIFKKLATVAIISICAFSVFAGTTYGMLHLGLVQIDFKENSEMFSNAPEDKQLENVETLFLPEYIPDNYQYSAQMGKLHENDMIRTIYTSSNGSELSFQQNVNDIIIKLDNENTESSEIDINNNKGILQEKNDFKILIWAENNYFYSLSCNSPDVNLDELKKIAESTTKETSK